MSALHEKLDRQRPGLSHGVSALLSDVSWTSGSQWGRRTMSQDCNKLIWHVWRQVIDSQCCRHFIFYHCVHSRLRDALLTFTIIYCGSHIRMNPVSVSLDMFHASLRPLGWHWVCFWSNVFQCWKATLNNWVNQYIIAGGAERRLVTSVVTLPCQAVTTSEGATHKRASKKVKRTLKRA